YCEKKFAYHRLFDKVLYSFEIGSLKPARRPFEVILKRLGSKPKECMFIDDDVTNLNTAEELGLKTIQFMTATQLKKELTLFSIDIE
ncbi:MAG TPA: hypothetical protein ENI51_00160, partial [Candidatus Atribacteria bacterium]|nr:hypothetical protein [Candidatus Atribacteria bacterium]